MVRGNVRWMSLAPVVALCTRAVLAAGPDLGVVAPPPTLDISPDGACGSGMTCLGSNWGECCSSHGYCGSSDDYCGTGCNGNFGTCKSAQGSGGGASSGGAVSSGSPGVCRTVTSVVGTSWIRSTSLYTATTLVRSTSVLTSVMTITTAVSGTANAAAATPSPILPGTVKKCKEWYKIREDIKCSQIADVYGINMADLRSWNEAMSLEDEEKKTCKVGAMDDLKAGTCRIPCSNLWPGYYICVGR